MCPLNWFVGEIWKYLELWAREALEGFKQSFMDNSGRNSECHMLIAVWTLKAGLLRFRKVKEALLGLDERQFVLHFCEVAGWLLSISWELSKWRVTFFGGGKGMGTGSDSSYSVLLAPVTSLGSQWERKQKGEWNKRETIQPSKERNTDAGESETETTTQNKPSLASGSDLNMAVSKSLDLVLRESLFSLSLYLYSFFGDIRIRRVERTWSLKWNR